MSLFVPQNYIVAWNAVQTLELKSLACILEFFCGSLIDIGGKSGSCGHSKHNHKKTFQH